MRTINTKSLKEKPDQFATTILAFAKAFAECDQRYANTNWPRVQRWAQNILDGLDEAGQPKAYSEKTQAAAAVLLQRQPTDYANILETAQRMTRLEQGESTENVAATVKYVNADPSLI